MQTSAPTIRYRLLTRHFLRQFLENDLISPDADRSQLLAIVSASILSLTLFVSVMMSMAYATAPLMTPALAATLSLSDKYFYIALGMIVAALVAASQWDALAIDARDAAILEPLPVPTSVIRRAKLAAVAILGALAALAVNAAPSLVFPALLVFGLKQVTFFALLALIITHAVVTVAASAFGYVAIIALRETLVAVMGVRWFTRISPWVQGALIVTLGGALLLLPAASNRVAQRGFEGWRVQSPPTWFLGAYEMTIGGMLADQPPLWVPPRQVENNRLARELYRTRRSQFPELARRAGWALAITFTLAVAAHTWNARRLPTLAAAPPPAFRRRWARLGHLANAVMVRSAAARAGFYFALAAMWRSNTHRLTLACAAAVGLALAVVALSSASVQFGGGATPRLLSVQPFLYGALLVGFRHAIRVPAELRANWGFQLAWRGHHRAFVAGVKSAAIVALVAPAVAVLLPLFIVVMGPERALLHAALGLAGGVVLLEALMLYYEKVPFTCTYLPSENMKALGPIYAIAFVIGAALFARLQHGALHGTGAISAIVTLAVLFATLRAISATRPYLPHIQFDESPTTVQRLGLDT